MTCTRPKQKALDCLVRVLAAGQSGNAAKSRTDGITRGLHSSHDTTLQTRSSCGEVSVSVHGRRPAPPHNPLPCPSRFHSRIFRVGPARSPNFHPAPRGQVISHRRVVIRLVSSPSRRLPRRRVGFLRVRRPPPPPRLALG